MKYYVYIYEESSESCEPVSRSLQTGVYDGEIVSNVIREKQIVIKVVKVYANAGDL